MFLEKFPLSRTKQGCCILLLGLSTTAAVGETLYPNLEQGIRPPALVSASLTDRNSATFEAEPLLEVIADTSTAVFEIAGLGKTLSPALLENERGGADLGSTQPLSGIISTGVVGDNRAVDVATGSNAIRDGAFTNASGIPVVIQNTGANVLIQNSTVVNVQLR